MNLTTYPLDNYDYSGNDAALFHCTRTTGIYAGDDFSFTVSGADNVVKLGVGLAWMRISRFKGLVAALKNEVSVDLGIPDAVYPRIDRVVLQFDANRNSTAVAVKKGNPASNPIPPVRSTTEMMYEIHLLEVLRRPGATAISAADVTDLRLDPTCCGLMADSVTSVDTSAVNAQVVALIEKLRQEINEVEDGSAYELKSKKATVTLRSSGWVNKVQTVSVPGMTSQYDIFPAAEPSCLLDWMANVVRCTAQGTNTLTFACETVPEKDIVVNVKIFV